MKNTISARHIGRTKYVSGSQAAQIIGVAHSTFSTWRKKGVVIEGLHPRQFGAREFFPVADVKEFARTHHPRTHAEAPAAAPVSPAPVAPVVVKPKRPARSVTSRNPADVARIAELEKVVADMRAALLGLTKVSM